MSKTTMVIEGLREFAGQQNNRFTAKMVAAHFNVSEDTARKVLRTMDGLQPMTEGKLTIWSFVTSNKRVIKTSPEARNHKILRYFRSACYNAAKLGLSQETMMSRLAGWLDEYEIEAKNLLRKVA